VPSNVRDGQTKKEKLGPVLRGELTPAPQIFRVCGGGRTRHISSKNYMGPTPFYGARAEKPPFCQKANERRLSGDITIIK